MIKYNSTEQFFNIVKKIRSTAEYHNVPLPVIKFTGTVKMHGTNAAVVVDAFSNKVTLQSREREITVDDDNAGFAAFIEGTTEEKEDLIRFAELVYNSISSDLKTSEDKIQIYGEWIGPGIQKGVGINNLPQKIFVVFKVRVGNSAENTNFIDFRSLEFPNSSRIKSIYDFPLYEVEIDFNQPELSQNRLVELTTIVANDCPVARQLLPDFEGELLGEGIVWSSTGCEEPWTNSGELMFKTKDKRHSVSKIKTVASIDVEKIESINKFVEYAVTENRLNQGLDYLREMKIDIDVKNTGEFIRWVVGDIMKEELETMIASNLEPKTVNSVVARKAREFFLSAPELFEV